MLMMIMMIVYHKYEIMKYIKHIVLSLFILYFVIIFFKVDEYLINIYRYLLLFILLLYSAYLINKTDNTNIFFKKRLVLSIISLILLILGFYLFNKFLN